MPDTPIESSDETQVYTPPSSSEVASFGKYRLLSELGKGSMGVVYKGFDPSLDREVAIKTLSPDLLANDRTGEFRERFRNEMRAAGKITHPNVINVFDAGEEDGTPYFVMEYVEGEELKKYFDNGEVFTLDQSLKIMSDVLAGLSFIHSNRITHRDLKPGNIVIAKNGSAKIADFGVAKTDTSELTRVGTLIGSPRYMAPEQCQGLHVDARSDLFSAGIIFYQLLTNEHCFDANSQSAIMQKIVHAKPEPPSLLIPTLPDAFDAVVLKALEKHPDKRFQSADAFKSAIDEALNQEPEAGRKGIWLTFMAVVVIAGLSLPTYIYIQNQFERPVTTQNQNADNTDSTITDSVKNNEVVGNNVDSQPVVTPQFIEQPIRRLNPEDQKKVDKLLRIGRLHRKQGRLVTPSGSSAYDAYQIILGIDPENEAANSGLVELQDELVEKVTVFIEQGEVELALSSINAGADAFPQSSQLTQLRRQLSAN